MPGIEGRSVPFELKWSQVLSSMAKTRIVTPNTGSKRKKSCQTEAVGSSLDKTLTNYVNWDWFVSKLWPDQLWQTTFAGDLAVWRPQGVPTRSPVTTLLLWVHTVEDDLQEIVSFSQSAAVWLCQQVQFDSKCFPLSNRLSIVLFTDGGSVTSERSTFGGLGRRTTIIGRFCKTKFVCKFSWNWVWGHTKVVTARRTVASFCKSKIEVSVRELLMSWALAAHGVWSLDRSVNLAS